MIRRLGQYLWWLTRDHPAQDRQLLCRGRALCRPTNNVPTNVLDIPTKGKWSSIILGGPQGIDAPLVHKSILRSSIILGGPQGIDAPLVHKSILRSSIILGGPQGIDAPLVHKSILRSSIILGGPQGATLHRYREGVTQSFVKGKQRPPS